MAAYVYIRWSSKKQEKGHSKERQLNACVAFCARRGWELAEPVFGDFGVSAWHGNHLKVGNLGRFADRVRAGEVPQGSVLVVEDLDRLSRQEPRDARNWIEEMTDAGLSIATVNGERIFDKRSMRSGGGLIDAIEILVKANAAHEVSEKISGRLQDSWVTRRRKAAEGVVITRHVPGWLTATEVEGKLQIDPIPARVEVVQEIYRLSAEGVGARSIARILNERGMLPFGKAYHHRNSSKVGWEHTYVSQILASAAVEGDYEPGIGRHHANRKTGERCVGYFGEPIVDADVVARARAGVQSRKGRGGRNADQCRNLFSGLAFCDHCQGKMTMVGNSRKPARYLQCSDASRGRGCDQKRSFAYDAFEAAALDALLPLALDDRYFQRPDTSQRVAIDLAEAAKAVALKEAEAGRLVDSLSRMQSLKIEARLVEIETEIVELKAMRADLEAALLKARGAVSPKEHMRRVMEVRDAINHPDHETRVSARRKVAEAIRAVDVRVGCKLSEANGKTLTLYVMGGSMMIGFDNTGRRTFLLDFLEERQLSDLFGMDEAEQAVFRQRCDGHHLDDPHYEAFKKRRLSLIGELNGPLADPLG